MGYGFDTDVLQKLKQKRRKQFWRRTLSLMMCVVVFCTTYALILPAITQETVTFCGQEAHVHTAECFPLQGALICGCTEESGHTHSDACNPVTETVPVCGLEESDQHTHTDACNGPVTVYQCGAEAAEAHVHSDACYASPLICPLEENEQHIHGVACYHCEPVCQQAEHEHSLGCYSDPNADLEDAAIWEATLPADSKDGTGASLLAVARSQLGYTESTRNYKVSPTGDGSKGYTRYGAWYGEPYGDWNAMFVAFCLHYAGVQDFPQSGSCPDWAETLRQQGRLQAPADYVPKAGDILFLDADGDGTADRVAVVEALADLQMTVIEGDHGNQVARQQYQLHDNAIVGYASLRLAPSPEGDGSADSDADPVTPDELPAWADLMASVAPTVPTPTTTFKSTAATNVGVSAYALRANFMNAARSGTTLDLTPYINSVTMYDANKNPLPNGATVTEGDLIEFRIEYTVTGQQLAVMNGENVTKITDTLTYQLPKTFQIVQSDSGNIRNSSGQVVGTYVIDSESGVITMTFTEDYVEQNAKGIQIHGNISFFSTVKKVTTEESENQDHKFTDGITLGVIITEKEEAEGDLSIEKEKVSVDGEDLTYEIKVSSTEGTKGPITITDQMSAGLTFKESVGIWKGNNRVNNASFNVANDKRSFSLTLPEMAAGETYRVRYKCSADIDLLGADMTVQNTATVTGKNSQDKELKDRVTVDHTFDVLKKTGTKNEDGSISWTITVNQAKADISGWTLKDIIRLQNQQVPYTGPVTIRGSSGNIVANNVTLPYTFPNGSKDTYTVTYTTTHDYGDGDTIYNSAILSDDDTDVNVLAGVVIGTPFTKTGEAGEVIQDENGNYLLPITWTITIDTRNGPISGGLYFVDEFRGYPSDDMYMTYDQLMTALANFEAEVLRVSGEEVEWLSAWVYQPGPDTSNEVYSIIDLWGNKNNCQSKKFDRFSISLGSKGIPQGEVLTFSYECYGIFANNIVATTRFVNRFNLMDQYETEGVVDYVVNSIKGTKYAISYYDPETQADEFWFWSGGYDWNSVEGTAEYEYNKLKDGYLAWAIEISVPPNYTGSDNITLYEDLPEGVSVKGLRWPFQNPKLVDPGLRLDNMEPGNIYTWDFMLYPADQYGQWRPQGGQMVSITVNYTEARDLEITVPGIVYEVMGKYAALHGLDESYGYLAIFTQIDDDFEWTPESEGSVIYVNNFENRFTIKNEKDVVIDVGSQTQRITKDESDGTVKKTGTVEDGNIINYAVILNGYKKDLVENSNVLAVHDLLTYNSLPNQPLRLRLVPGSVKLYEVRMKSDGGYEKLGEVTVNYKYAETSYVEGGITRWRHTIDMTVPDSKSLLLEYSYKATGSQDATHNVSNSCTITGVGQGGISSDSRIEIEVLEATAQADTKDIMIYKVDANSDGIFLENAKFNIYIWNKEQGKYIIVNNTKGDTTFTTDANGMIVLDASTMGEEQFAYNTAYYIVEIESPSGYYLGPEPYYFYIRNDNTEKYPSCIPQNFVGNALTSGDIIYRQNVSKYTEITVEKYWQDHQGASITVTGDEVTSVTLELWQMLQGDPASAKRYGTYTMTPDAAGNWSLTITDLPKSAQKADGTRGADYLYYIKEVGVNGYALESSENNDGIRTGTIKLTNRKVEGYVLPETGGMGPYGYITAGWTLTLSATGFLLYRQRKRRREAY